MSRLPAHLAIVLTLHGTACSDTVAAPVATDARAGDAGPIRPIPPATGLDPRQVALGHRLFEDPRLSSDGAHACAACHDVAHGGADGRARSVGVGGVPTEVNTPTVLDAALESALFWDGRARTLEEQVDGPLLSPTEMGGTWESVIDYLRADPSYRAEFAAVGAKELSPDAVRAAIAMYERSLVTPDERFDRWLQGDEGAITPQEKEGYRLFQSYGCASCHQGADVGGNMFQVMGAMGDYFRDRGGETRADRGRYNVTGDPDDMHVFRVPSLRLAAKTAPYFHDGSAETLEDAVQVMARYQLGREIPPADREAIVAFLGTLPGEPAGNAP